MPVDIIGSNGVNGTSGAPRATVGPGNAGSDGTDGQEAVNQAFSAGSVAAKATGGMGGTGGAGGAAMGSYAGGAGGDGGEGGPARVEALDITFAQFLVAEARGGRGGWGGVGGATSGAASLGGAGGDGGSGGDATALVQGLNSTPNGLGEIRVSAIGGQGGFGAQGFGSQARGRGGEGGDVDVLMTDWVVNGAQGADALRFRFDFRGGDGGGVFGGQKTDAPGRGGNAHAELTNSMFNTYGGNDVLDFWFKGAGGHGGHVNNANSQHIAQGANGVADFLISGVTIDLGEGDDQLNFVYDSQFPNGTLTIANNTFRGGDGYDTLVLESRYATLIVLDLAANTVEGFELIKAADGRGGERGGYKGTNNADSRNGGDGMDGQSITLLVPTVTYTQAGDYTYGLIAGHGGYGGDGASESGALKEGLAGDGGDGGDADLSWNGLVYDGSAASTLPANFAVSAWGGFGSMPGVGKYATGTTRGDGGNGQAVINDAVMVMGATTVLQVSAAGYGNYGASWPHFAPTPPSFADAGDGRGRIDGASVTGDGDAEMITLIATARGGGNGAYNGPGGNTHAEIVGAKISSAGGSDLVSLRVEMHGGAGSVGASATAVVTGNFVDLGADNDELRLEAQFTDDQYGGAATRSLNFSGNSFLGGAGVDTLTVIGASGASIELLGGPISGFEIIRIENAAAVIEGLTEAVTYDLVGEGADRVAAGALTDTIRTYGGADLVRGGGGDDVIDTGAGDDVISFSLNKEGFDAVIGGAGYDVIKALANNTVIGLRSLSGVEKVDANGFSAVSILGSGLEDVLDLSNVTLINISKIDGGAGNDALTGGAGADLVIGGAGSDTLAGGLGDDTFQIGLAAGMDSFDGGLGIDRIIATASKTVIGINALSGVEQISANGFLGVTIALTAGDDLIDFSGVSLTGITKINAGSGADQITGSAGADTIVGGAGNDVLLGGDGNDTFELGAGYGADIIDGGAGQADRIVGSKGLSITWTNITGIEAVSGSSLKILGTAAGETLDFSGVILTGVSKIFAGGGNDTVIGSANGDVIEFSTGQDVLTGGGGADIFDIDSVTESRFGLADLITDFEQGVDKISLTQIDASTRISKDQAFTFIGARAFTAAGQLRVDHADASSTQIYGDVNGDNTPDFQINLPTYVSMTGSDFLL